MAFHDSALTAKRRRRKSSAVARRLSRRAQAAGPGSPVRGGVKLQIALCFVGFPPSKEILLSCSSFYGFVDLFARDR